MINFIEVGGGDVSKYSMAEVTFFFFFFFPSFEQVSFEQVWD